MFGTGAIYVIAFTKHNCVYGAHRCHMQNITSDGKLNRDAKIRMVADRYVMANMLID
jgi:hypothetical protein